MAKTRKMLYTIKKIIVFLYCLEICQPIPSMFLVCFFQGALNKILSLTALILTFGFNSIGVIPAVALSK